MKKQTIKMTATNVVKLENGDTRINMSPVKEDSQVLMGNLNIVVKDSDYEQGKNYLVEITKIEEAQAIEE